MNPATPSRRGLIACRMLIRRPVVDQQGDLHRLGPDLGRDHLRGVPVLADLKLLRREVGQGLAGLIEDHRIDQAELLGRRGPGQAGSHETDRDRDRRTRSDEATHARTSFLSQKWAPTPKGRGRSQTAQTFSQSRLAAAITLLLTLGCRHSSVVSRING